MNSCEYDVLNNKQQSSPKKLYNLGSLIAIMDIGNYRKKQEDSTMISNHKKYQDIELLIVADGMGGLENGAMASRIATLETWKWFQSLDQEFKKIDTLKKEYKKMIYKLDDIIREKCIKGGTTLITALVINNLILVINIGDSRAYAYTGKELIQITNDHSIVQKLLDDGIITNKDDMRFHKKNNLILSRLGCETRLLEIDFHEVERDKVSQLFLFSDGITDCVSDFRLKQIISSVDSNIVGVKIMEEALENDSFSNLDTTYYYNKIPAGKDNASIVYKLNRRQ